jgi:hypothetical protein
METQQKKQSGFRTTTIDGQKRYIVQKTVYVRRAPSTLLPGADEDDRKVKIGSYLGGRSSGRALTDQECAKYLPRIIGVSPSSPNWDRELESYWANISVNIPSGDGLKLDVSTHHPSEEDAINGTNGEPIKVEDWILWRHCLVYNRIANKLSDVNRTMNIIGYLYSKEEEIKDARTKIEIENKAYANYVSILGNFEAMRQILLYFKEPATLRLSKDELEIQIHKKMKEEPARFLAASSDAALPEKAFLERCIIMGELKRIPNTETIIYKENIPIGNDVNEAVAWIKNSNNKEEVEYLKNRLKAFS